MENIRMELEKLFCYTLGRAQITRADMDTICTRKISNQIFDMMNAIGDRNQKKALTLYYDLLSLKEPPMRILFLIARQFRLLAQVKECKKRDMITRPSRARQGCGIFLWENMRPRRPVLRWIVCMGHCVPAWKRKNV